MRKPKRPASSSQPKIPWSHRNPGATTPKGGKRPDVAEVIARHRVPIRSDSIPPLIDGLYAPPTTECRADQAPETKAMQDTKDAVQRELVAIERQKFEEVMRRRVQALQSAEAARNARIKRQEAQVAKRAQEDYGATRKKPKAKRRFVSSHESQPVSPIEVQLCPVVPIKRIKEPYVRVHVCRMKRAS